jgi:hypothetical protein
LRAATANSNTNSAGDSLPPPLEDPELAATVQTLTGAAADPKHNVLLLQLAHYDAKFAALEAHFNAKRDEKCFELWNSWASYGKDVDGYEYDCWCGPRSAYSAIHCHAYSDAVANATMHKMEEDNRKQPGFGNLDGSGGGGRRLAESFEAVQRATQAARSPRAATPVGWRALMLFGASGVGKGASAAANDRDELSTAFAPYYGGAPLASPSTALVASHGRKLQKLCGLDPKDANRIWQFIEQAAIDTTAQLIQCMLVALLLRAGGEKAGLLIVLHFRWLTPHTPPPPHPQKNAHQRGPRPRHRGAVVSQAKTRGLCGAVGSFIGWGSKSCIFNRPSTPTHTTPRPHFLNTFATAVLRPVRNPNTLWPSTH